MKAPKVIIVASLVLFAVVSLLFIISGEAFSIQKTDAYTVEKVIDLEQPVQLLPAPGGYKGDMVLSAKGSLFLLRGDNKKLVADLSQSKNFDSVRYRALSVAFPPDWKENPKVYLYTAAFSGNAKVIVWQYEMSRDLSVQMDSAKEVIGISSYIPGHDGGAMHFDSSGNLWMGIGDGGCCGDPKRWAQDSKRLLSKIIRIRPKENGGYTIPKDNPFLGQPEVRPEIVAFGVRNPWRWSFQGSETWIADVGENAWEEINVLPTKKLLEGRNFGWSRYEGKAIKNSEVSLFPVPYEEPLFVYPHREPKNNDICYSTLWGGSKPVGSVSGGTVAQKPLSLKGQYIFADFCFGKVFILNKSRDEAKEIITPVPYPVSVDRGFDGETYIVSGFSDPGAFSGGAIYRLVSN